MKMLSMANIAHTILSAPTPSSSSKNHRPLEEHPARGYIPTTEFQWPILYHSYHLHVTMPQTLIIKCISFLAKLQALSEQLPFLLQVISSIK